MPDGWRGICRFGGVDQEPWKKVTTEGRDDSFCILNLKSADSQKTSRLNNNAILSTKSSRASYTLRASILLLYDDAIEVQERHGFGYIKLQLHHRRKWIS
jgi:hypothetical protein